MKRDQSSTHRSPLREPKTPKKPQVPSELEVRVRCS